MAANRDVRSFVMSRDPSIDRRFRPRPTEKQKRILFGNGIDNIEEHDMEDYDPATSSDEDDYSENYDPLTVESSLPLESSDEYDTVGALVYLRFRPTKEISAFSAKANVLIVGPSSEAVTTSNNKNAVEKQYIFTDIFHRDIPQADVYENCVRLKIDTEDNFTLLTYGTSGSGKTYTLLGTESQPGIIPRSLEHIFTLYAKTIYPNPSAKLINGHILIIEDRDLYAEVELREKLLSGCNSSKAYMENARAVILKEHDFSPATDEDVSVFIWITFIEIYNENVYDLLEAAPTATNQPTMMAPPSRRNLRIVGNDGNVFVKDLTSVYVKNSAEALYLLKYGLQRANYAATNINHNSSRSHCVFTIDVIKYSREGAISHLSYRFCDLAGSERQGKTGNMGSRLKEAQGINKSLHVLGRCLDAANSNSTRKKTTQEIIPYRESKLTTLLQSAFLGKEKLMLIVNIMPVDKYYEENINVLGFASIAKNIVFKQPTKKVQKSRCSFLMEHSKISAAENEAHLELLKENIFLRSEVGRLTDSLENQNMIHAKEILRFEQSLRDKLSKTYAELTQKQVKAATDRCLLDHKREERVWQRKYDEMVRKYEWKIDDLKEENELLKKSKKRRTTESPQGADEQSKRPALDVEILVSDDDQLESQNKSHMSSSADDDDEGNEDLIESNANEVVVSLQPTNNGHSEVDTETKATFEIETESKDKSQMSSADDDEIESSYVKVDAVKRLTNQHSEKDAETLDRKIEIDEKEQMSPILDQDIEMQAVFDEVVIETAQHV